MAETAVATRLALIRINRDSEDGDWIVASSMGRLLDNVRGDSRSLRETLVVVLARERIPSTDTILAILHMRLGRYSLLKDFEGRGVIRRCRFDSGHL